MTAGSVLSPAIGRVALVARHFGLPCIVYLGGTKPETAFRNLNVAVAALAGAEFRFLKVGYNPALQKALREFHASHPDWYRVAYGVGIADDASDDEMAEFYSLGAQQVATIPDEVERLVIPAGSCNATTGIMVGLAQSLPPSLTHVDLIGLGPSHYEWMQARLARVCAALDVKPAAVEIRYHDLFAERWTTYAARMPYRIGDLVLHPTYEGKALAYMAAHSDEFAWWWAKDGRALFWIVGSESSLPACERALA